MESTPYFKEGYDVIVDKYRMALGWLLWLPIVSTEVFTVSQKRFPILAVCGLHCATFFEGKENTSPTPESTPASWETLETMGSHQENVPAISSDFRCLEFCEKWIWSTYHLHFEHKTTTQLLRSRQNVKPSTCQNHEENHEFKTQEIWSPSKDISGLLASKWPIPHSQPLERHEKDLFPVEPEADKAPGFQTMIQWLVSKVLLGSVIGLELLGRRRLDVESSK